MRNSCTLFVNPLDYALLIILDNASFMSISAQQPSSTRAARLYRFGNSWLLLLDGSFSWPFYIIIDGSTVPTGNQ